MSNDETPADLTENEHILGLPINDGRVNTYESMILLIPQAPYCMMAQTRQLVRENLYFTKIIVIMKIVQVSKSYYSNLILKQVLKIIQSFFNILKILNL